MTTKRRPGPKQPTPGPKLPGQLKTVNISKEGLHADGGNLYLQVTKGTRGNMRRSWLFIYQRGGKSKSMGLGPVHTIGLAEARDKARECRKLLLDGKDPLEHKRAEKTRQLAEATPVLTFDDAAKRYLKKHINIWPPASYDQWANSLRYVSPIIGKLAVTDIDTPHVLKVLEPIWHKIPTTAARIRGRIERILADCTVRGERAGDNPARWAAHLKEALPAIRAMRDVKPMTALAYAELPAFWIKLQARPGTPSLALQFAILTCVRSQDVRETKRADIDFAARLWTIPKFSKTGKEHRVPLSDAALDVAAKAIAGVDAIGDDSVAASGLVFPNDVTGQPLSENAMLAVLKRMGMRGRMTTHGCRATFRTWTQEQTEFAHELCEMALGHTVGSAVERAYARSDGLQKRFALMQAWADFVTGKPAAAADNVVELGAKKRRAK